MSDEQAPIDKERQDIMYAHELIEFALVHHLPLADAMYATENSFSYENFWTTMESLLATLQLMRQGDLPLLRKSHCECGLPLTVGFAENMVGLHCDDCGPNVLLWDDGTTVDAPEDN